MVPGVFIRDHVRLAHQMPVNQFAPGHFEIDAFQAVEEGSMSEPRQRCGALERQVLIAGDYGEVRAWHRLQLVPRIAVGHQNIQKYLQGALPVYWLAQQQNCFDRSEGFSFSDCFLALFAFLYLKSCNCRFYQENS